MFLEFTLGQFSIDTKYHNYFFNIAEVMTDNSGNRALFGVYYSHVTKVVELHFCYFTFKVGGE